VDDVEAPNQKQAGIYTTPYNSSTLPCGFYFGMLKVAGKILQLVKVQIIN